MLPDDVIKLSPGGGMIFPEEVQYDKAIIVDEDDPRFYLKWVPGKGLVDERDG